MKTSILSKTYKNKRILVTGHTGFKGSWLAIWLKELGADVIGYALEPETQPNNYKACKLEKKISHTTGDVRDLEHLLKIFKEYKPEFVFHLAAQAIVRRSYSEPKMTFDTNVGGTVNILEAVRLNPSVKVFVNVTSDKCYENREWIWGYRECDPMGGHDPYSASKGCAELVFAAYMKSFFSNTTSGSRKIGMASARAGNVIGGGDWSNDRLIPDCVRALVNNESIGIRNPRAIRPWQHVLEPLGGYLLLGAFLNNNPEAYSGSWNFGPNETDHLTVDRIVSRLIEFWGTGRWEDLSKDSDHRHEAATLKLCCEKARMYLKWQAVLRIDESIQMTCAWYKHFYLNKKQKDMYQFCADQIREYMKKAQLQNLSWPL
jgi:CDP-glucose 4,6-dehydratase